MNAPAPTPAEQQQIDRFGIFAEEAREAAVLEEVARAMAATLGCVTATPLTHRLAAAAVAAYRATQDGGAEEAHPCSGRFCRTCADAALAQQAEHRPTEIGNMMGGYDCVCGEPWLTDRCWTAER